MAPIRRVQMVWNAMRARLAAVGADPRDDEPTRQSKALLVLTSVLILPIAVVWGSLYLLFGSWVGYVPFLYAFVLLGAIVAFALTQNLTLLVRVNQLDILLAPTLSMIPLGGFLPSAGVGMWPVRSWGRSQRYRSGSRAQCLASTLPLGARSSSSCSRRSSASATAPWPRSRASRNA